MPPPDDRLLTEIVAHYAIGGEHARLDAGPGRLELERSRVILERTLPPAPAVVCDIGGGPGRYAFWLAARGYTVHMVDLLPEHVEQARALAAETSGPAPATIEVGDARELAFADGSADAVTMMGPLYHLTERADRMTALRECARVLRPGGVLVTAYISRFASAIGGMVAAMLEDERFAAIVEQDLADGQHRNADENPDWFTTSYFHRPEDVRPELEDAGLAVDSVIAVEGPAWMLPDLDARFDDAARREVLMRVLGRMEAEPSLLGASAHVMAVSRA